MKHKPLRISMQYFAETAADDTPDTINESVAESAQNESAAQQATDTSNQEKTYTAAEYDALQKELDTLRKEHLSQEERARIDLAKRENDVATREATVRDKENQIHAIQSLEQAHLIGNGITSSDLIPFVMDSTAAGIDSKVKAMAALLDKRAQVEKDSIYKSSGRQPQQVHNDATGGGVQQIFNTANVQSQANAAKIRDAYTRR